MNRARSERIKEQRGGFLCGVCRPNENCDTPAEAGLRWAPCPQYRDYMGTDPFNGTWGIAKASSFAGGVKEPYRITPKPACYAVKEITGGPDR